MIERGWRDSREAEIKERGGRRRVGSAAENRDERGRGVDGGGRGNR